ncbi:Transcription factor SPATULA like [Actinidia chinensis var. chinensis]|uniref:Transcription factor SPATULA like n=1 Tax=Actinidia chinensis var. chinensis TaxID=1590841 RepID=A0A2R6PUQ3_ACTCC|nr:Transcription factor SPATULA like [Actinidia chinensis var. chinensis]
MEGRGGCCIERYTGGGAYNMSKVGQIMLRFRPIAPKPAAGGSVSPENTEVHVRSGRGKRKYVRDGKRSGKKTKKASSEESDPHSCESFSGGDEVVTLPLLPETPDRKDSPARRSPSYPPVWLSFSNNDHRASPDVGHVSAGSDQTVVVMPQPVRLVGSIVTVECVMETWVDSYGFGCSDEERVRSLDLDTCPGFVSDGYDCVGWTNGAYREMVGHSGGGEGVVWLVVKERAPISCGGFTCRVKVQYTCGKERSSITLPCDVWKMYGGGFAWRLDVEAALCLGR